MIKILRQLSGSGLSLELPIFASEDFLASKSPEYGWFVSDKFALPFVVDSRLRKLGFKRIVFTTESIPLCETLTAGAESAFLEEVLGMCERGKDIRADSIATQANAVFSVVPSRTDSLAWGSYVVDLTKSETAIFDAYDPKHKNMIRRAVRGGVAITTTTDINPIYQNLRETMARQNLLFFPSISYLSELQRRLKERITFYIALHDNRLQGSAVVVHNQLGAFYYYGGSVPEPFPGSLTLMQYEIMKDLKRKTIPVYDLMGARIIVGDDSKIEGIQRFKRRFASGMRIGYCFRRIVSPVRHRMLVGTLKTYFVLKGSRYTGDVIDQTRRSEATFCR